MAKKIARWISPSTAHPVRAAAAQTICLLVERFAESQEGEEAFDAFELDGFFDVGQAMEDLQDYSSAKSKAEEKVTKDLFSSLLTSLESGVCPFQETFVVQRSKAVYDDWCTVTQIEWLRDYLQGGMLAHLSSNELIHQILDIDPENFSSRPERLSQQEKRATKSKCSQASKDRSQDRRRAQRKAPELEED
jgi:hypothetical protein